MKTRKNQLLILRQLDKKLIKFKSLSSLEIPAEGWVKAVRTALNMSLRQLGERLGQTAQGASDLEKREKEGTITLNSLREASQSLNLKLVYVLLPHNTTLEQMVEERAQEIAKKIVKRTSVSMALEDQENSNERLEEAVKEMTYDIKKDMSSKLWD